jgi:hypothetical protein
MPKRNTTVLWIRCKVWVSRGQMWKVEWYFFFAACNVDRDAQ